ncbi:MAG: PKD domain-containing protein [Bacteroidetes bacterium]|nr:PKD domain-containing protein [Bacteroidota bacterium]
MKFRIIALCITGVLISSKMDAQSDSSLFFSIVNLCQSNTTFEIQNYHTGLNYFWDFGDGANETHSVATASHVYAIPGYYEVSVTAENGLGGCNATYTELIRVVPSIAGGYNDGCCSDGQISDHPEVNGSTSSDEVVIDGSYGVAEWNTTVWPNSTNISIKGNLIIRDYDFRIKDLTIEFGPNSKVIIEPGASLVLDNAELKGLQSCGTMWQGIEVWGSYDATQNTSDQGLLSMINASAVRDAHIGVLLGKASDCIMPTGNYVTRDCPFAWRNAGGIIQVDEGSFVNCAIGVKFLPYTKEPSVSSFVKTTFNGGDLLDPGYTNGNPEYTYSSIRNPHFTNSLFAKGLSSYGIYTHKTYGLGINTGDPIAPINRNEFSNLRCGIAIIDAPQNVSNAYFVNCDFGLRIENTISTPIFSHRIDGNHFWSVQFKNGFEKPKTGIYVSGGQNDIINENTFSNEIIDHNHQSYFKYGILCAGSGGISIKGNEFTKLETGVDICNSGASGGVIGSTDDGTKNRFTNCNLAVSTNGLNPRMQVRCNEFDSDDPLFYGGCLRNNGELPTQGRDVTLLTTVYPGESKFSLPAGNLFTPDRNAFSTLNPNPITYIRHHDSPDFVNPSDWTLAPDPVSTPIIVVNTTYPVIYNDQSCICSYSTSGIPIVVDRVKLDIANLIEEYEDISANLDNGRTNELLVKVQTSTSAGKLTKDLKESSPLSDQVLEAYITRPYNTPPGNFKEVMIPNSPVSDQVYTLLDSKIEDLPPGIEKQIREVQGVNTEYRTPTMIGRDIGSLESLLSDMTSRQISSSLAFGDVSQVLSILSSANNNPDQQLLAGSYLAIQNPVQLAEVLSVFVPENQAEEEWLEYAEVVLEMASDTLDILLVDSLQEAVISTKANSENEGIVVSNARSFLFLKYEMVFPPDEPIETMNTKFSLIPAAINMEEKEESVSYGGIIAIHPNPFSDYAIVEYCFSSTTELREIQLFDKTNRLVKVYYLNASEGSIRIDGDRLLPGIYVLRPKDNSGFLGGYQIVKVQ